MSVAIDNTVTAQLNKNAYDSQFDVEMTADLDDDTLGPAKMCIITCLITGI
ncbi:MULTISPECIES: hypothetical protein [Haladaptatus]|uniref:Uncharacterized protein n=1 Tax=Haladaptatus paucihalophilus DX253 TaxID=797209 RepID=A0A1M6X7S2_HALPU|nr:MULTISPECIES: hypothetical protein [Haladaptatus]GKZ14429.1 hypothetical protein HAL_23100 [Haladaptatus sp. T7]SHL02052.1 hypothetical protein SAMN05444342_2761 [Haladaptatus paucihalophilus DX253]